MIVNTQHIVQLLKLQVMNTTQKAFAEANKLSKAQLCETLKGDTPPSDRFAKTVGYTKLARNTFQKV